MTPSILNFFNRCVYESDIKGKTVVEVGSRNVNGSVRDIIMSLNPESYTGIDSEEGEGADIVGDISEMHIDTQYDVVIATELLEHVRNWHTAVNNIRRLCKKGGLLLITTRSRGFPYHPCPEDYWRFELADLANIFHDFTFLCLEADPIAPGVFMKAKKEHGYLIYDLYHVKEDEPLGYSNKIPYIFEKTIRDIGIASNLDEIDSIGLFSKEGKTTFLGMKH